MNIPRLISRLLRTFPHVNLIRADMLTFRPDGEYDVIFCSGVLHYIPQPLRNEILGHYRAHTAVGSGIPHQHCMDAIIAQRVL